MPTLTVFTPVYNRADIIDKLYRSLCRQTSHDFEWVVVDDGSTDNIVAVMDAFINEGRINIRFIRQANGGKHTAINRGVAEAQGSLFFIVDSDDYLADNAVEWILDKSREIAAEPSFAGLSGVRVRPDGTAICHGQEFGPIDADAIAIREVHHVTGDLAEVYKTDVMRRYPFPVFEGEKFCSEGVVWNRMSLDGLKVRYYNEPIYICEYLAGGLSATKNDCRVQSPESTMTLYSELIKNPFVKTPKRLAYALLFWRFSEKSRRTTAEKNRMLPFPYRLLRPFGAMLRLRK